MLVIQGEVVYHILLIYSRYYVYNIYLSYLFDWVLKLRRGTNLFRKSELETNLLYTVIF